MLVMESRLITVSNIELHVEAVVNVEFPQFSAPEQLPYKNRNELCTKGFSHMNQMAFTAVMTQMFAASLHMSNPRH